jgi:hypothetical protein
VGLEIRELNEECFVITSIEGSRQPATTVEPDRQLISRVIQM